MKKALVVTTVSGFIPQFEMNDVKILQEMGYEIHYAANYNTPSFGTDNHRLDGSGIVRHQIDFVRSPYNVGNIKVYKQLKLLMETEGFDLVHCHTPMGSVMTRLVSLVTQTGPVIYTAHGFHFFKGAPMLNWLFYYPVERWLSHHTYQLICINQEDYCRAKGFHAKHVDYIPGVGIDLQKIQPMTSGQVAEKKRELGIAEDKKVILTVGELIKRKNHESVIRAIAELKDSSCICVICGHGTREKELKKLARKLKVENQVIFAGYRTDIMEIYQVADLYIFPSWQEGLPMALLEAMGCGLPIVCSDIRGNIDLMGDLVESHEQSGWSLHMGGAMVRKAGDVSGYVECIRWCLQKPDWREACGKRNQAEAARFSLDKVEKMMRKIYHRACVE